MQNRDRDIEGRDDIIGLLEQFYTNAFKDDLIGHFFTTVIPLDLEVHIPLIADFWESILFNKQGYKKNVMEVHHHINQLSPIQKHHLDRWVLLFTDIIEKNFKGAKAELMKQRARSIATLMDIRINHSQIGKT